MLLAQNISLVRSDIKIFENINISLSAGKVISLKGKNGSGKTTLLKTMLNLFEPTSGTVYWKGKILKDILYDYYNHITFIADKTSSLRQLSVNDNINIWKKLSLSDIKNDQVDSILKTLKLYKYKSKKVSYLSLGEMKKLELIRLIIENKKVWILDEPFTNLDSYSLSILNQTFEDHSKNLGSIIFSTHQDIQIRISEEIIM